MRRVGCIGKAMAFVKNPCKIARIFCLNRHGKQSGLRLLLPQAQIKGHGDVANKWPAGF